MKGKLQMATALTVRDLIQQLVEQTDLDAPVFIQLFDNDPVTVVGVEETEEGDVIVTGGQE